MTDQQQQTLRKKTNFYNYHKHTNYLQQPQKQVKSFAAADQQQQQQQQQQQTPIKISMNQQQQQQQQHHQVESAQQVQRKLFSFLFIYAILIVVLYATYAAYYFYQHHSQQLINSKTSLVVADSPLLNFDQLSQQLSEQLPSADTTVSATAAKLSTAQSQEQQQQQHSFDLEAKLESKIHLLEKYIEVIAIDLQETKNRLREREKCDCSLSCTFNGTRYADRQSWQNQCDICTCQAGRISCQPQKCPILTNCDDSILLPGQCCPTCMKKCKYNNTLIRHGQKFKPLEATSGSKQQKECKCHDGRIRCEQVKQLKQVGLTATRVSTTSLNQQQQQQPQVSGATRALALTAAAAAAEVAVEATPMKFSSPAFDKRGQETITSQLAKAKDEQSQITDNLKPQQELQLQQTTTTATTTGAASPLSLASAKQQRQQQVAEPTEGIKNEISGGELFEQPIEKSQLPLIATQPLKPATATAAAAKLLVDKREARENG